MAALSPTSKVTSSYSRKVTRLTDRAQRVLARLRAFTPPPTSYYKCPLNRRAAVLILLYEDRKGYLRVVLTIRSASLKNYAGQAALPGGKADSLLETPWITARREALEEIGLPMTDDKLPAGYTVEHLAELPCNLAMTELAVRPCVAFLSTPAPSAKNPEPDVARDLLPKLDAKEVAAMFTAPFYNLLRSQDVDEEDRRNVPGEWYRGSWHSWHETAWRMHQFFVPVTPATVFHAKKKPPPQIAKRLSSASHDAPNATSKATAKGTGLQPPLPTSFYTNAENALQQPRYRVFGMTARILVDCARVAYGEEPEYEHNSHFGDEDMMARLLKIGRLSAIKKEGQTLTRDVMMEAARAKM